MLLLVLLRTGGTAVRSHEIEKYTAVQRRINAVGIHGHPGVDCTRSTQKENM